jgi:hypothetical protein
MARRVNAGERVSKYNLQLALDALARQDPPR